MKSDIIKVRRKNIKKQKQILNGANTTIIFKEKRRKQLNKANYIEIYIGKWIKYVKNIIKNKASIKNEE